MKNIIAIVILVGAWNSYACQCDKYPVSHREVINNTISKEIGEKISLDFRNDVEAIKAYPTLVEKVDLFGFRGTSCEVTGPQGEFLYHCINRVKYDYKVVLNNCEFIVRAKSNYKRAKAKLIAKTCY